MSPKEIYNSQLWNSSEELAARHIYVGLYKERLSSHENHELLLNWLRETRSSEQRKNAYSVMMAVIWYSCERKLSVVRAFFDRYDDQLSEIFAEQYEQIRVRFGFDDAPEKKQPLSLVQRFQVYLRSLVKKRLTSKSVD